MRTRSRWIPLFLLPFLFDLWLILVRYRGYVPGPPYDELLYYTAGGMYIEGLQRLDFSVFAFQSGHPPLSKIFIGLFRLILSPFGLDIYPIPVRLCTAFFLGLTCTAVYELGEKMGDSRVGLASWFLHAFAVFSTPLEMWLGSVEISGIRFRWDLGVPLMPIDHPHAFFSSLCVYYAFEYRTKDDILPKVGLFLGLAALCKFPAIPILSVLIALWMFEKAGDFKVFIRDYGLVLGLAAVLFYIGNPAVWNPLDLLGTLERGARHEQLSFYYARLLSNQKLVSLEPGTGGWVWFFSNILFYPIALFIDSPLFTIFPLTIVYTTLRGRRLDDAQFLVLLWFSITYIFISQCAFTIVLGSYFVNYYVVAMFPPLAVYCSLAFLRLDRDEKHREIDCGNETTGLSSAKAA